MLIICCKIQPRSHSTVTNCLNGDLFFWLKNSTEGLNLSPVAAAAVMHQVLEKVPDGGGKAATDFHTAVTFRRCVAAAGGGELWRASPSPRA